MIYSVGPAGARVRLHDGTVHDFPTDLLLQFLGIGQVIKGDLVEHEVLEPATYDTRVLTPRRKTA